MRGLSEPLPLLWRAGLRISEALALARPILTAIAAASGAPRQGRGTARGRNGPLGLAAPRVLARTPRRLARGSAGSASLGADPEGVRRGQDPQPASSTPPSSTPAGCEHPAAFASPPGRDITDRVNAASLDRITRIMAELALDERQRDPPVCDSTARTIINSFSAVRPYSSASFQAFTCPERRSRAAFGRSHGVIVAWLDDGSRRAGSEEPIKVGLPDADTPWSDADRWKLAPAIMFRTVCWFSFRSSAISDTVRNVSSIRSRRPTQRPCRGVAQARLGLRIGSPGTAKTRQADRRQGSHRIPEGCAKNAVILDEELAAQGLDGFGATPAGEDLLDATVGQLGMIQTLRRSPEPEVPDDPTVSTWKIGYSGSTPTA